MDEKQEISLLWPYLSWRSAAAHCLFRPEGDRLHCASSINTLCMHDFYHQSSNVFREEDGNNSQCGSVEHGCS